MTKLLEIKDKIFKFYGEYETYIYPVVKFILALVVFLTINSNIGYNSKVTNLPVALVLSLICCLLPINATLIFSFLIILIDLYTLSLEAAIIGLVLFIVVYFIYFRFASKYGVVALLTPVFFRFNIPYVLPIGVGLKREIYSVVGVACGAVSYYFLDGVRLNASTLHAAGQAAEAATEKGAVDKFNLLIGQIAGNREMYMTIAILVISTIVTNLVRKIKADHAWTLAIFSGVLIQLLGMLMGYAFLGVSGKLLAVILGNILALIVGFVFQFMFMHLDYARTERVQFEDDAYYYYVKAVPKKMVTYEDKKIKHFGNTASMGKRIERKSVVEELIGDDDK